jgi:hypothetical protein
MVGPSLKILFEGLRLLSCRDASEALTEESKTPASSLWDKFSDISAQVFAEESCAILFIVGSYLP